MRISVFGSIVGVECWVRALPDLGALLCSSVSDRYCGCLILCCMSWLGGA